MDITTARMRGEPLGPQHLDDLAPMFADPRVAATLGGAQSREQVGEMLDHDAEEWARDGFGPWMLYDRETGEPVGRGGLNRTEFDGAPEVEVAWLITPERWNQGFATELGAAAVEFAFAKVGLPNVVAFTLPDNLPSRRVMEKLGFAYEKTAPYKVYGDHVLYRLRAS
jgi:RimJ/RimL family protein N-acetyltransferase